MRLDGAAVRKGCPGVEITTARHLCGSEIATFKVAAAKGDLMVGCTLQAPLFEDVADAEGLTANLTFTNLRETAGWSSEGNSAGPKMAALLAAARIERKPGAAITFKSEGVTLLLGRDDAAIAAARRLGDRLDLTVLVQPGSEITVPSRNDFPIRAGRVRQAKGYLGAFEVAIDGFAEPVPSSRNALRFGPARNGAVSQCDIIIDLTGNAPLFEAHDLRAGYLRANPDDAAAVASVLFEAADLVGTFDKPRYVDYKSELCAHSRSRITGCRRCLDVCPAGAITPNGDTVAIDPHICGGCGACAAVCPTGAASYAVPASDTTIAILRALLTAWRAAGGTKAPVILIHDGDHGQSLIEALARFGDGLPAHVLPLALNEAGQLSPDVFAAAFAYGAGAVRILLRGKPRHDPSGLRSAMTVMAPILAGLGYGQNLIETIETDDPDALAASLLTVNSATPIAKPAAFLPVGLPRDNMKLALRELRRAAPTPVETIALTQGAPFGRVVVDTAGCTLCLSCVSACPTSALGDAADRPQLSFDESLCVQCGLCQATCPEKVITLEPRLDFAAFENGPQILKAEEPFCCTKCGKAFGVKSTIDRITAKLAAKSWMFQGANADRLALITMCDDCRVATVTNSGFDPYATTERPRPRTSDDYFKAREAERAKPRDGDES
jgi:ferredoxin